MHHSTFVSLYFKLCFCLVVNLFVFVFVFAAAAALGGGCTDCQALGIQVQANAQQEKQQCNRGSLDNSKATSMSAPEDAITSTSLMYTMNFIITATL